MGKEDQVPGWNRQLGSKLFGLLHLTKQVTEDNHLEKDKNR